MMNVITYPYRDLTLNILAKGPPCISGYHEFYFPVGEPITSIIMTNEISRNIATLLVLRLPSGHYHSA